MSDLIEREDATRIVDKFSREEMFHYMESLELDVRATQICHSAIEEVGIIKEQIEALPSAEPPYQYSEAYVTQIRGERDFLQDMVNDMAEQKTGEWIPVSERLPEKDGRYLVTYPLIGDDLWVSTAWYGTPPMPNRPVKGKCFFVSDDEWGDVPYDDVMAWMPLPEPYREGGKEDD